MTDNAPPPEGIGPHEGRELELMLAGRKPLAMFGDALGSAFEVPEADFALYVAEGAIIRREEIYRPPGNGVPGRFVYFARAGEEWRIEAMHRINERLFVERQPTTPDIEREIGRLLGYTEADIDRYLDWIEGKLSAGRPADASDPAPRYTARDAGGIRREPRSTIARFSPRLSHP